MVMNRNMTMEERKLLFGEESRYGIYQIIDGSPGREYEFMDLNFIERHGYQVRKEDYELHGYQVRKEDYELNSHARLACYTMNKTGVASGSFS